ncbi:hypothetical protein N7519_011499 [Penicillium mononematosum]|uniref:uncharacterized protein n=1 Tax=Penicillium mononematosum TaxID=268346 RepID=UPI002547B7CE|nr:uncharacterized protein N7519_011499 [Penicillium mononematosum]KAJ6181038.1 hypothetical protein N7519_011499 [Penicillium mononematosum]
MAAGRDELVNGEILSAELIRLRVSTYSGPANDESMLDEFIESTLQPALAAQQTPERVDSKHPFFDRAKELCLKHDWPIERFENFRRLLCGNRTFPNDLLPFDEMVDQTPTLTRLEDVLDKIGLGLDDVIIMDLFPMLTDEWLDGHPAERDKVIPEMFKLTLDFIRGFKLHTILSCQCFRPLWHERWGSFDHGMLQKLCSRMDRAKRQIVSGFSFENHYIHCVAAFHPAKFLREDEDKKQELRELLCSTFHSLFEPCAAWLDEYDMKLDKSLDEKTQSIKTLIEQLQQSKAEYDEILMRRRLLCMSRIRGLSITAEPPDNRKKAGELIAELWSSKTPEKSLRDLEDLVKREYPWIS